MGHPQPSFPATGVLWVSTSSHTPLGRVASARPPTKRCYAKRAVWFIRLSHVRRMPAAKHLSLISALFATPPLDLPSSSDCYIGSSRVPDVSLFIVGYGTSRCYCSFSRAACQPFVFNCASMVFPFIPFLAPFTCVHHAVDVFCHPPSY